MRFLLVLWGCFAAVCGDAQIQAPVTTDNPLKTSIDSIVHRAALVYMQDSSRMGLSVGILYREHSYLYNYGQTGPGTGVLPSARTLYEIGSITKTFTALLLAHALEEKRIDLNDDIRKYLKGAYPDLHYANGAPVRVVYLLAHIARFPRIFSDSSDEDLEHKLQLVKLDSLRPYRYQYSNAGYQVLGEMMCTLYGKTYDELLSQYITGPLKMSTTRVNFSGYPYLIKGYDAQGKIMPDISIVLPGAGSIRSTMSDMMKYMDYQLKEPDPVVRMTHHALFGDVLNEESALPWAIGRTRDWDYYIREDGGTKGYRSFMQMYPDYQTGFMLLTNQTDDNAGRKLYEMTTAIFNELKARR
jgi:D-alanyl-D-alanine-carboxypeptidase/D-alanyl-D-alanine-endopeptidase